MPPLVQSLMVDAAKTRFRGFDLSLASIAATGRPVNVGQFLAQSNPLPAPAGITSTMAPASTLGPRTGAQPAVRAVPQPVPPALIKAASNESADVDFQSEVSNEISGFIEGICAAIVSAHNLWRQAAFLQNVQVSVMTANGGSVHGPALAALVKSSAPQASLFGAGPSLTQAVADGLDACWRDWQTSVHVPGLSWWPTFVAFPGPAAPPTPNVPTPFAALTWAPQAISVDTMAKVMRSRLTTPAPFATELFMSISTGVSAALDAWFPAQMVTNVLGRGSVPTFAPPYVPVGPVVTGDIIAAPPHFAT